MTLGLGLGLVAQGKKIDVEPHTPYSNRAHDNTRFKMLGRVKLTTQAAEEYIPPSSSKKRASVSAAAPPAKKSKPSREKGESLIVYQLQFVVLIIEKSTLAHTRAAINLSSVHVVSRSTFGRTPVSGPTNARRIQKTVISASCVNHTSKLISKPCI